MRRQTSLLRDVVSWVAAFLLVGSGFAVCMMLETIAPISPALPKPDPPVVTFDEEQAPVEDSREPTPPPKDVSKPSAEIVATQPTGVDVSDQAASFESDQPAASKPSVDDPFERELGLMDAEASPTAVESHPKPIEDLTANEVFDHVVDYRNWCEDGQITILLAIEQLTPAQLDSLVEIYVLRDATREVFIDRSGHRLTVVESAHLAGLEGELKRKSRWPDRLRLEAVRQFAQNHAANASFRLAPRPTLLLYRLLGEALGPDTPVPGTRVTLQIAPDDGGFVGKVIEVQRPKASR